MSETSHEADRLGAYLDGELDLATRDRVAAHLQICAACRDELERLRDLQTHLQTREAPDPGAAYWGSFASRVERRIAASQPEPVSRAALSWWRRGLGWLRPEQAVGWTRLAGAAAVVLLVVFVGARTFRMREAPVAPPMQAKHDVGRPLPDDREARDDMAMEGPAATTEAGDTAGLQKSHQPVMAGTRGSVAREAPASGRASLADEEQGSQATPSASQSAEARAVKEEEPPPASATPHEAVPRPGPPPAAAVEVVEPKAVEGQGPALMGVNTVLQRGGRAEGMGAIEVDVRHPPEEVEELTLQFVRAALASDVTTARFLGEDLRQLAPGDSSLLRCVDLWLRESSVVERSSRATARRAAPLSPPLLALDDLVWPHREDPAWHGALQEVAQRLAAAAPASTLLRERAVARAEWLLENTADPDVQARWRETLERLQP